MGEPAISVIIPCHNGAKTIGVQLEALSTQIGAPAFEVIVVDNASTDNLGDVLGDWYERLPELRTIKASSYQGASYARNVGIGAARAEKLLFCDADDCVSAYWVAHGWANLLRHELFSGSATSVPDEVFEGSVTAIRGVFGDSSEYAPISDLQDGTSHPVLMGGDFGITRSLALRLQGFDQSMPVAGEDNDMAIRLQKAGVPVVVSPSSRIAYRARTEGKTARRVSYRAARAHALLCARYGLWQDSPHVQGIRWVAGPIICLAAGAKMVFRPHPRDWPGLMNRFATNCGFLVGFIKFGIFRRVPSPNLGVGIDEGLMHRSNAAV